MRTLITGGAGSIGSEVARRLAPCRVADVNEESMWLLGLELPEVECVLADVQHIEDVGRALDGCDAVIHCAAYKHVRYCQQNPAAARRVNVDGTRNVMDAACGLPRVLVSTDKAIEPICTMGDTKAKAEQVAIARGAKVVRFGNVLGSRGSLLPAVVRYAALGRPIPLTDHRMTRFVMTSDEAVDLILEALHDTSARDVVVTRDPRSVEIRMLLEVCRDILAPGLPIVETMPGPGERFHERLVLRDGTLVTSRDERYLMTREAIESMIVETLARMGVAA